jgi:hypothetical protein
MWRGIAPVAVDDWQFCTSDTPFNPEEDNFDDWVAEADWPDSDFVTVNATTATCTSNFSYCAARYQVGETWSSWTGVVYKDVI